MDDDKKKEFQISIEVPDEVANGVYANLSAISNSATEFVLDFIQLLPGQSKAKVKTRIVMSPETAHGLYNALGKNLSQYDEARSAEVGGTARFDQFYPTADGQNGQACRSDSRYGTGV